MAATLLRQSALRTAIRSSAPTAAKRAAIASTTFTRGKATLPDLPCKKHSIQLRIAANNVKSAAVTDIVVTR